MAAVTAAAVGAAGAVGGAYLNSKAGSKGASGSSSRKTRIPSYLKDASKQAIGIGRDIADRQYDPVAAANAYGLTDVQKSGIQQAQSLQGAYQPYLAQANDYLGNAGGNFSSADAGAYMNPYINNVLDVSAGNLSDAFAAQQNARDANAAAVGAFGGLRAEIGKNNAEDRYLSSIGDLYQQGLGSAYETGRAQFNRDRANQLRLGRQYQGLAQLAAGLQGRSSQAALQAGGLQQLANQNLYTSERDFDAQHRLQPLLAAASSVPHGGTNIANTQQSQSQQIGTGGQIASALGGGLAAYGAYNQFAGGNNGGGGGTSGGALGYNLAQGQPVSGYDTSGLSW